MRVAPDYYRLDADMKPVPCGFDAFYAWVRTQPENWFIVKQDQIGPFWVSTVYLHGIDSGFNRGGPPILWETMIFMGKDSRTSTDYQDRYSSYAAALAGHIAACDHARHHPEDLLRENHWSSSEEDDEADRPDPDGHDDASGTG